MVHELVAALFLDPFEHRKTDDPQELEIIRLEEVLLPRDVEPELTE